MKFRISFSGKGGMMFRQFFLSAAFFCLIAYSACTEKKTITSNIPPAGNAEYIILFGMPNVATEEWISAAEEDNYFNVINIRNNESKGVPAVVELEGTLYLPAMSRMPSYHEKVVEGVFIPDTNYFNTMTDTIFRVTRHCRDTVMAGWPG